MFSSKQVGLKYKFQTKTLEDLLKSSPQYGANESAIEGNEKEDVRYIRITDINESGKLNDDFKTANKIEEKYLLIENDLLIARSGATAGKSFLYKNKYGKSIFAGYLIRFKINEKIILPDFVYCFLQLTPYKNWVQSIQRPSGQPNINSEEFKSLEIPVPEVKIQEKIVEKFIKAFELKEKRELNSNYIIEQIDQKISEKIGFSFPKNENKNIFSVSIKSFENRLDPHFYLPSFKGLIDNIRLTKNAQLGDLVEFSKETWNQKDGFENDFPYIEISEIDLSSGKINNVSSVPVNEAPSRARMVVRENDIIVSTTRPHRGAISLIDATKDGFIASTGFVILRTLKTNDISKEYLFYILRTQICLQQMLQRSSGGSYPAITGEELKNIFIPIPSKEIQSGIVNEIKASIEKAEKLKDDAKLDFEKAKMEIEALILG